MYTFEKYQLGIHNDEIEINTSEEHQLCASIMARQSRREISIISRELDPPVYDAPDFVAAVKKMVLANRHSRVRVLLFEPQLVSSRGHQLLNLAMNLPSFIEFRKPGKEYHNFNESLFVADSVGYIYRNNSQRFEGNINFNDKRKSKVFMDVFEEMWNRSMIDPNLRRITL